MLRWLCTVDNGIYSIGQLTFFLYLSKRAKDTGKIVRWLRFFGIHGISVPGDASFTSYRLVMGRYLCYIRANGYCKPLPLEVHCGAYI